VGKEEGGGGGGGGARCDFRRSTIVVAQIPAAEGIPVVRAMFYSRLGTIRERLQVDIGFCDSLLAHAEEWRIPWPGRSITADSRLQS